MGYTTDFNGEFRLDRQLDLDTHTFLANFNLTRHMKRNIEGYGVEGEFYLPKVKKVKEWTQETEKSYSTVVDHNRPPSTQPGLWCQWTPNDAGTAIIWDSGEKFYEYVKWLQYLITNFLAPKGYTLNGKVEYQGEDSHDFGVICVEDNKIAVTKGLHVV